MDKLKEKIKKSCGKGLSEIIDDIDTSIRNKGGKVFIDLCLTMKDVICDSMDDVKKMIKEKLEYDEKNEEDDKEEKENEKECDNK